MDEQKSLPSSVNPLLLVCAALALGFFVQQSYRLLSQTRGRPKYKSQSRRPQIARWESEGGSVPEVQPLQSSKSTH